MSEWKYDIDEVGEDAEGDDPDEEPDRRERGPIEPGSPTAENVLFVTLGIATMLFVFARLVLVVAG
ncbi:DUF7312 domain-containing protein [Halorussus litoreus]|uniref:DUF7312 domain-containing protein n=1 Tax=Halorussus litoreus TaxID=1710536 RepID=UPI000E23662F|nr:hypothetical protein [Halorussus litoreus]